MGGVKAAWPGWESQPLHTPIFGGREWEYVKECIDTGWVSSVGSYVDRFEVELAAYTGVRRAVATVNGTAALHVSLLLAGVERDDEVILPALTFVATANAISYCGAVPHFADSSSDTLGLDPDALDAVLREIVERDGSRAVNRQTGRKVSAIVPVHTFGHPCRIDAICEVGAKYGIPVVEDAAESLGSYFQDRHTGGFGKVSALSFNGNKILTTGGGGAILTNDDALADRAKHLTTTAKKPHAWDYVHDEVGFNYRMPNVNAAIGCAQLEQLQGFLRLKRELHKRYQKSFKDVDGVSIFSEPTDCQSNYWLQTLVLDEQLADQRNQILSALNNAGFGARPCWNLLSELPMYRDCPSMSVSVAQSLVSRMISLPSNGLKSDG